MSLRYAVLSLLALFIIVLLSFKNYDIWTRPIEIAPEKRVVKKLGATTESPSAVGVQKETKRMDSHISISEKNIFNPERKEFPIQSGPGKKPNVRPQIVLYGVTVMGDYQSATIVDPTRAHRKGEREMLTLMKGEQIGEYKLTKILPDRIALEAAEDTFEVLLYDPRVAKKRSIVKTETKPAVVTSTSPAATPPEAPKPAPLPAAEKPRVTVQERVSPPPVPQPTPSLSPSPTSSGARRRFYPPSGTPTPQGAPAPAQPTGEN
jgi:hypothetical protein